MDGDSNQASSKKKFNPYKCCGCVIALVALAALLFVASGPAAVMFITTRIEDTAVVNGQLQASFFIHGKGDPAYMFIATGKPFREQSRPWKCSRSGRDLVLGRGNELTVIWESAFEINDVSNKYSYSFERIGAEMGRSTIKTLDLDQGTVDLIQSMAAFFIIQFKDGRAICQAIE